VSTRTSRVAAFLGLRRATVGVLLVVVLVGSGEHLAERFLPIYLLALGGGPILIGLLQAMDNLSALCLIRRIPGGPHRAAPFVRCSTSSPWPGTGW
jgi:hypothetical protein